MAKCVLGKFDYEGKTPYLFFNLDDRLPVQEASGLDPSRWEIYHGDIPAPLAHWVEYPMELLRWAIVRGGGDEPIHYTRLVSGPYPQVDMLFDLSPTVWRAVECYNVPEDWVFEDTRPKMVRLTERFNAMPVNLIITFAPVAAAVEMYMRAGMWHSVYALIAAQSVEPEYQPLKNELLSVAGEGLTLG